MGIIVMTGYDWNKFLGDKSFWENRKCKDPEICVNGVLLYDYLSPVKHEDVFVKVISGTISTIDTKEYVCTLSDLANEWCRRNKKYMCATFGVAPVNEEFVTITILTNTKTATTLLPTILRTSDIKSFRAEKNTRGE